MSGITLPGLDRLPAGPHRELVEALHELYRGAGKPSVRRIASAATEGPFRDTVSHETVSAMLHGKGGLPRWEKVDAVVRVLTSWNPSPLDPAGEAGRVQQLWLAAHDGSGPAGGPAAGADAAADAAPHTPSLAAPLPLAPAIRDLAAGRLRRRSGSGDGRWPLRWRHRWPAAAAAVAAVIAAAGIAVSWPSHQAGRQPRRATPPALGNRQDAVASADPVQIKASSLSPVLAAKIGLGRATAGGSVPGFLFRNAAVSGGLCLSANTAGYMAGRNGDGTELRKCSSTRSQIWIPVQWERTGQKFTWLANYAYQSKCLNADSIGGLANGRRVQLWNCYNAGNEYWDFGDWHDAPDLQANPSPIFLKSGDFCLDANKYRLSRPGGDPVHIWNYYGPPNQLWR